MSQLFISPSSFRVLDTNVFVSSLLVKAGILARIPDAWWEREHLLTIGAS